MKCTVNSRSCHTVPAPLHPKATVSIYNRTMKTAEDAITIASIMDLGSLAVTENARHPATMTLLVPKVISAARITNAFQTLNFAQAKV